MKRTKYFLIGAFLLLGSCFFILSSCSTQTYMGRVFAWGSAGGPAMQDYFPTETIEPGSTVFQFTEDPEAARAFAEEFTEITYRNKDKKTVTEPLNEFFENSLTDCFIIILDDTILFEYFAPGTSRKTVFPSFSVSKSYASALVGAAIERGHIESIDDPIYKYLPEYDRPGYKEITIKNLLAMNSGFRNTVSLSPFSNFVRTYFDPDIRSVALNQSAKEKPGTVFNYNNANTQLLGIILERTTGKPVTEFLSNVFWRPLGMEASGKWSIDSEENRFEQMASGLYARPYDYARFGRLFLNGGNWNGKQILDREWVDQSTTREWVSGDDKKEQLQYYQIPDGTSHYDFIMKQGGYYAYHWWGFNLENGEHHFFASGMFGQSIYLVPDKNAIILRFGKESPNVYFWSEVLRDIALGM